METLDKIQERKNKKTTINNRRTQSEKFEAKPQYTEANKQVKKNIKADNQKYEEQLATTAEQAPRERNMKQIYDATKKLAGRQELVNRPAPVNPVDIEATNTDLPIALTPSTIEEIKIAIRQNKSRKAAAPENIPAEALMSDIEVTSNIIDVLFEIWEEEQVPTD
ncbi:unnamed protein product [Schistosoma curassoni]|uniref:NET domain-containing protein n=1 Tax=Schistosoma curassoni TaxID=6186 RepID=A0A183JI40_9TREM|nr:unnamed protein product [Schistosoma curassoni]